MTIRHVIFDCDGTLVDSETLSMRADVLLLARFGITLSEKEAHSRFVGRTFQAMLDEMTRTFGTVFPPGLHEVKNHMLADMYPTELRAVPGLPEVLDALHRKGLTLSVGSNSPTSRVELSLRLTGITDYFSHVVTFENVAEGKPAPDIFLRCAELAGAAPGACLVVEDSLTGLAASKAAGIPAIGFAGTSPEPEIHAKTLMAAGASNAILTMPELLAQI